MHDVPGTTSAFAERLEGGHYVEIEPERQAAARYGLSVEDVQKVVATALGGETVTTTVEGRERYGVNLRYPRDLRDDPQAIASQVLVPTISGAMVPLGQVAHIHVTLGPPSIRTENAQPVAYIYVDLAGRDLGGYVEEAARKVAEQVKMPPGYHIEWSGQFEYLQRAEAKLKVVVPATLVVILVLLFLNFGRLTETLIVMLSVPFALVGGVWLMWVLGYNMSVAVAVGFIALAGVAAETGVVMLIYLDQALTEIRQRRIEQGIALSRADLRQAIMTGAVERVRPKMMTVVAIMAGCCRSSGARAQARKSCGVSPFRWSAGMVSSTLLTLLVIPAIYSLCKIRTLRAAHIPSGWRNRRRQNERQGLGCSSRAALDRAPSLPEVWHALEGLRVCRRHDVARDHGCMRDRLRPFCEAPRLRSDLYRTPALAPGLHAAIQRRDMQEAQAAQGRRGQGRDLAEFAAGDDTQRRVRNL